MSVAYWNDRWDHGRVCPGSVGDAAAAKATFVNGLVDRYGIESIVDWGCGDGYVASMIQVPLYIGVDTSPVAVELCRERLGPNATVGLTTEVEHAFAELGISLDVVFHLIDDHDYELWMERLFTRASRLVAVHGTDLDTEARGHMRHHHMTRDAPPGWTLVESAETDEETPGWFVWTRA